MPKNDYLNWKVIYVIGDLFMDTDYEIRNENVMYVKCEDSYIHLLKKEALAIKHIYKMYNIKQGILKCCDDLIFNEPALKFF